MTSPEIKAAARSYADSIVPSGHELHRPIKLAHEAGATHVTQHLMSVGMEGARTARITYKSGHLFLCTFTSERELNKFTEGEYINVIEALPVASQIEGLKRENAELKSKRDEDYEYAQKCGLKAQEAESALEPLQRNIAYFESTLTAKDKRLRELEEALKQAKKDFEFYQDENNLHVMIPEIDDDGDEQWNAPESYQISERDHEKCDYFNSDFGIKAMEAAERITEALTPTKAEG